MYELKRDNISFEVSRITERRKPCLTVTHKNKTFKVGQFNDMETAQEFFTILDYVCFGNNEDKARAIIKEWEE